MTMPRLTSLAAALSCAITVLSLSSCVSPSFERDWRAAVAQQPAGKDTATGAWRGSWVSEGSGHTGKLRCIISPADQAGTRQFLYRATWGKLLAGNFKTAAAVKADGSFKTHQRLGRYGSFDSEARIKGDELSATYRAMGDRGRFEMQRAR